ncbi:MAG: redoxin domain-containing protein [Prolixibacteraceae bacterium]|nr:redoxin domain-containing protein [Prolixibacteraceae bacterium]
MKKLFLTLVLFAFIGGSIIAKEGGIPLIGSKAPSFTAESTNGKITFPESFGSSWKILFSHPQDFTPVCTSELLELAYLHDEFEALNVKVAVISTDEIKIHHLWKAHIEELDYKDRGPQKIHFPIIDDHSAEASETYGMLHKPVSTNRDIRGVFVIDSNNTIRSVNFYPMEVGRNITEIIRLVEALKTTDEQKVFTPANWNNGDDVLVPYFPYTTEDLSKNPTIQNQYYSVGNRLWFKKTGQVVENAE